MTCYHPVQSLYHVENRRIWFDGYNKIESEEKLNNMLLRGWSVIPFPCNNCVGCSLTRSLNWTVRLQCHLDYRTYDLDDNKACFLTLTYDGEHLPADKSVHRYEITKFFNKVRKNYRRYLNKDIDIQYFACGEYGEKKGRPHYHAIVYGIDFFEPYNNLSFRNRLKELEQEMKCQGQDVDYTSEPFCVVNDLGNTSYLVPWLSRCWSKGRCCVGSATVRSMGYVARYCCKKSFYIEDKKDYYVIRDDSGFRRLKPEFLQMSNGIGKEWFLKYYKAVYERGSVMFDTGKKYSIPRAFDKWLEQYDKGYYDVIKARRLDYINSSAYIMSHTPEQLRVKEELKLENYAKLIRHYECSGNFSAEQKQIVLVDKLVNFKKIALQYERSGDFCYDTEQKLVA